MENKTDNKVFYNPEGYIEIILHGEQTGESFLKVYEEALPLIDSIKAHAKPLLGLCDLTDQTGFSLRSDKVAMEYMEKIDYHKIAMFHVPHLEVTKAIILAMGKSHNTKIFDSREEALAWLLDPNI
jgi:hypothetical protein